MQQAISYRDRDGFVLLNNKVLRRYVAFSYADRYDQLMRSGLYQKLVSEGLLIPHREISLDEDEKQKFYVKLEPEYIPFVSLPYEWTAEQWKEVAITLLNINSICIKHGMILKDGTPFNLTFYKGRCVFFDTLSFDVYQEGEPWKAYRQFCEMILGPLALMFYKDPAWGKMMQSHINGWPLSFISSHLPLRTWFNPVLLVHIHWHASVKNKGKKLVSSEIFHSEKLLVLWDMICQSIKHWKIRSHSPVWSNYYAATILSDTYLSSKNEILSQWFATTTFSQVIDMGSNDGFFSILAAGYAKRVLSIESDHDCVQNLRTEIRNRQLGNIETILADIVMPTPATGWENEERFSLLHRLDGDMLLLLAVIHHLCIGANIPMAFVAKLAARLTSRYTIVEFVPRSDPKVVEILINREDIFADYSEETFTYCFGRYFTLLKVANCATTERKLYLWEKLQSEV
ncbi:MAG: class I SAM-dependent methyltransferase [Bacteroidetes bacterium]|nr:class I SAM-dependent methyltransferase [Bacteroidota bacterium]